MFLRHLRLRNIRSIKSLDLSFDRAAGGVRPWTYLLGENGTGKSSILRATALVLAGSDALPELVGEPDDWIHLGAPDASIEAIFETQTGEERRAAIHFARGDGLSRFLDGNRSVLEEVDAAVAHSDRNYFVVGYGVNRRAAGDRSRPGFANNPAFRSRRAQAMATLFNADAGLVSIEQWAMDLDYRKGEGGVQAVELALNQLLPDVTFQGIDRERRQLMFDTADGLLPMRALSDGYQAMAAWCGDLLWQFSESFDDYRDPLKARGLLMVDELDLHLHPSWQRRLVSFLQATLPNMQVVVTTHSPLTVHQAGEDELFVLAREAGHVIMHPFVGAPNKLMLQQLLQSPLFGLETLDSPQVQSLREELRALEGVGESEVSPGMKDETRIRRIKAELSDVPDWRKVPPYLRQTNEVLEAIANELGGGEGVKSMASRATRDLSPDKK